MIFEILLNAQWQRGPEDLVTLAETEFQTSKSIFNIEPAQAFLYQQLRDQLSPSEVRVSQAEEWVFVLQMATLYWRMGCGLLALDLLRNWKFVEPSGDGRSTSESDSERKSSDDDAESNRAEEEEREILVEAVTKPPPKPVFEEPSTSSLLDSFGY